MALRTDAQWKAFFQSHGITDDAVATTYAAAFVAGNITEDTLPHLDKTTLTELGITSVGHRISVLNHIKTLSQSTTLTSTKATVQAHLTTVTSEMTQSQFRQFENDWRAYKQLLNLQQQQLVSHLYNACDETVRNTITNAHQDFFNTTEVQALAAIKGIVTRKVNPAVHRKTFTSLTQGDTESIQQFVVKLRSAAVECSYQCPNPDCQYDLSEINIRDQFIAGLANSVLQAEILARADQLQTLNTVIAHAEAFETAQRDQNTLNTNSNNNDANIYAVQRDGNNLRNTNRYNRQNNRVHNQDNNSRNNVRNDNRSNNQRDSDIQTNHDYDRDNIRGPKSCNGCGSKEHGAPGSNDRSTKCPAWGKNCLTCGKSNHFAAVCKSRVETVRSFSLVSLIQSTADEEDASVYDVDGDDSNDGTIPASITVGHVNAPSRVTKTMDIFPDSGAGICLGGTTHLEQLGHSVAELVPSNKRIKVVGGSTLPCLGWIMADFTIDEKFHTRQPLYIADGIQRIFFSKSACVATNILSKWYPHPMPPTASPNTPPEKPSVCHLTDSKDNGNRRTPPERPSSIPYPPTEENVSLLKQYLLKQFEDSAFDESAPFPVLDAKPGHIYLKPDAVPHAIHTFIPVPHHWKKEVKDKLDDYVRRGILAPVPISTPVTWCAQMVVARKKDGRPRITVDFNQLNRQSLRESHPTDSPFNLASQIAPHTKKTVIDAVDGYHAVELDKESQLLTMFTTEWGRYMYLRMPQGFRGAGDAYVSRYDDKIKDIPNKVKIVDDSCLYSQNIEQSFWETWDYLTLCAKNGIVVSKPKFQFCQDEVDFAGLRITSDGIRPSKSLLSSIADFPVPTNLERARAWFGLVNQVAWAYSISPIMEPFRLLIKPNNKFYWTPSLNQLFEQSKLEILAKVEEGVRSFEPNRQTCLQTDWCKHGVGYLLLQKHCTCPQPNNVTCCPEGWKLIYGGSRFTQPAESRYSPTEGEALGVSWALHHSRMFTLGCNNLVISVDHKPLLGIFNDHRDLQSIDNPRLQRFKESTVAWKYTIVHNPGKWHRGPDAMSRNPPELNHFTTCSENYMLQTIMGPPTEYDRHFENSMEEHVQTITVASFHSHSSRNDGAISLNDIREAGSNDADYTALLQLVETGFPPTRSSTDPQLREFWEVRHRLSTQSGVVFMDYRTVIPKKLRQLTLERLHGAHQGVVSMKRRANTSVYWPGLSSAIATRRQTCLGCDEHAPSQPAEPIIQTPSPEWPFQQICMDYFSLDVYSYLVTVDRFSGWPCVYHMKKGDATSSVLIKICRELFGTYGVPEEIASDGGPQFKSEEFSQFLKVWGIHHRKSSVEYPQSNGRAEVGVKTMKRIIRDCTSNNGDLNNDKALAAILQYRNTPLPDIDLSPAQILFHRNLKDSLPSHPSHYHLHRDWIISAAEREVQFARRHKMIATKYNAHTRPLKELTPGTYVLIQGKNRKWNKQGVILEQLDHRQYNIKVLGSGRVTLRNRRFIKPCSIIQPPINIPTEPTPPTTQQQQQTSIDISSGLYPAIEPESTQLNNHTTQTDNSRNVLPSASTPHQPERGDNDVQQKLPLALRKLTTFNKPGLKEAPTSNSRR